MERMICRRARLESRRWIRKRLPPLTGEVKGLFTRNVLPPQVCSTPRLRLLSFIPVCKSCSGTQEWLEMKTGLKRDARFHCVIKFLGKRIKSSACCFSVLSLGCNTPAYLETSGPLRSSLSVQHFPSLSPGPCWPPDSTWDSHSFTPLFTKYLLWWIILRWVNKMDCHRWSLCFVEETGDQQQQQGNMQHVW